MKQLFTHLPLQLALDCTENSFTNTIVMLSVPTDDIIPVRTVKESFDNYY